MNRTSSSSWTSTPLLNILLPLGISDTPDVRVQLPADKADPYTISDLVVHACLEGPIKPIGPDDEANPAADFLLYDNSTDELKGKIELK